MRKIILYNTMDTRQDSGFLDHHLVVVKDNSDLPLLEPEGPFRKQAQYRHKCRAATEVEANSKLRKSLIVRSRPMRGEYVPGDAVYCWRAGQGVHQSQGHWMGPARVISIEGSSLCVSHRKCAQRTSSDGIIC